MCAFSSCEFWHLFFDEKIPGCAVFNYVFLVFQIQYIFIYDAVHEMIKKKIEMEKERQYDEVESDGNANLTERKKDEESTYVEIQLNDEKCVYTNGGFGKNI